MNVGSIQTLEFLTQTRGVSTKKHGTTSLSNTTVQSFAVSCSEKSWCTVPAKLFSIFRRLSVACAIFSMCFISVDLPNRLGELGRISCCCEPNLPSCESPGRLRSNRSNTLRDFSQHLSFQVFYVSRSFMCQGHSSLHVIYHFPYVIYPDH